MHRSQALCALWCTESLFGYFHVYLRMSDLLLFGPITNMYTNFVFNEKAQLSGLSTRFFNYKGNMFCSLRERKKCWKEISEDIFYAFLSFFLEIIWVLILSTKQFGMGRMIASIKMIQGTLNESPFQFVAMCFILANEKRKFHKT